MDIPVFDLRETAEPTAAVVRAWEAAATQVGCFALTHHGVSDPILDACLEQAREFHDRDRPVKDRYAVENSLGNKGYIPADLRPAAGGGRPQRDYASMDFGPELVDDPDSVESILLGPNQWPDLPGFRTAVERYREAIHACAVRTAGMFARICGLDPGHLRDRSHRGVSLLRLLHYPVAVADDGEPPNGHTDYEWFTLIWQSADGLEVLTRDGRTVVVPAARPVLTVLIGDLLEVLSAGRLESTLHWVRPRTTDRYSLTYFYGPDFDQTVAPAAGDSGYPQLHVGRHLTGLRVRHFAHLRAAAADGTLRLPFELPTTNPLKAAKVRRLARSAPGKPA